MTDTFGERLHRLRDREGLTLEQLANAVDSTKSYVWELENKPNIRPSAELVYKLAKALGKTVGVLMGEKEPDELPEEDQVFFRNYQELRPDTKDKLTKIMNVLAEEDDAS